MPRLEPRQLDSSTARQQLDSSTARAATLDSRVSSTELDSSTRRVDATSYDGSTDASPSEISAFGVSLRASTGSTLLHASGKRHYKLEGLYVARHRELDWFFVVFCDQGTWRPFWSELGTLSRETFQPSTRPHSCSSVVPATRPASFAWRSTTSIWLPARSLAASAVSIAVWSACTCRRPRREFKKAESASRERADSRSKTSSCLRAIRSASRSAASCERCASLRANPTLSGAGRTPKAAPLEVAAC
jgi:hypothetical protein